MGVEEIAVGVEEIGVEVEEIGVEVQEIGVEVEVIDGEVEVIGGEAMVVVQVTVSFSILARLCHHLLAFGRPCEGTFPWEVESSVELVTSVDFVPVGMDDRHAHLSESALYPRYDYQVELLTGIYSEIFSVY